MGRMPGQRKGLSHIRTGSAAKGRASLPHQVHMRLVSLELERHRHNVELARLKEQVRLSQARVERLDAEARDLRALVDSANDPDVEVKAVKVVNNQTIEDSPAKSANRKRLRY